MTNSHPLFLDDAQDKKPPTPQLRFTDPVKFDKDVNAYFESVSLRKEIFDSEVDDKGNVTKIPTGKYSIEWIEPPTMVGLGVYLDCDYRLFSYMENDKYEGHPQWTKELSSALKLTVARAKQICHQYAYGSLFTAKSAQGPMFALKTVYKDHGYQEETNININKLDDKEAKSVSQLSIDELMKIQSTIDTVIQSAITDKAHQDDKDNAEDAEYEEDEN